MIQNDSMFYLHKLHIFPGHSVPLDLLTIPGLRLTSALTELASLASCFCKRVVENKDTEPTTKTWMVKWSWKIELFERNTERY